MAGVGLSASPPSLAYEKMQALFRFAALRELRPGFAAQNGRWFMYGSHKIIGGQKIIA